MENGAINATQIPTTSYTVDQTPLRLKVPVVIAVHAPRGSEYEPSLYVVAKDPEGSARGALKFAWQWPDEDDKPSKYRCFTGELSFSVDSVGEYVIGAYRDADASDAVGTPIPFFIGLRSLGQTNNGATSFGA